MRELSCAQIQLEFKRNSKRGSIDGNIMRRLQRLGMNVQFCWVPAHVSVEGEEKADIEIK